MAIDNIRLFNVLTRHQVYVEGVKAYQANEFNKVLRELDKEFAILFAALRYKTLDALTKTKMQSFLRELRTIQNRVYSEYTKKLIGELQDFMIADIMVSKIIFATLRKPEGEDEEPVSEDEGEEIFDAVVEDEDRDSLFPPLWFRSPQKDGTPNKLWAAILAAPIPANGILPPVFIAGFTAAASATVENIVRKGYANRSSVEDVLREITGTAAKNHRDGAFSKIKNQADAVTATAIQHTTAIAQAGVASVFYGCYRWVSVIDGQTTPICRGRNNRVFRYGAGPLPPAHIRCRSKTIPCDCGDPGEDAPSYFEFIKNQPPTVQNDILGATKASKLRNGDLSKTDMPQFDEVNPLSVSGFISKLRLILKR